MIYIQYINKKGYFKPIETFFYIYFHFPSIFISFDVWNMRKDCQKFYLIFFLFYFFPESFFVKMRKFSSSSSWVSPQKKKCCTIFYRHRFFFPYFFYFTLVTILWLLLRILLLLWYFFFWNYMNLSRGEVCIQLQKLFFFLLFIWYSIDFF